LKTKEKCWKVCEEAIKRGESVVIDNQNRAIADRAPYIKIAQQNNIPIRAIRIDMPKDLCFHLNEYRALNKSSNENRGDERVPDMVIHGFYKNVEEATKKEGFASVSTLGIEHLELQGTNKDIALIRSFLT
jgi:bifunctional polynucleotide phosphatase/kinase